MYENPERESGRNERRSNEKKKRWEVGERKRRESNGSLMVK